MGCDRMGIGADNDRVPLSRGRDHDDDEEEWRQLQRQQRDNDELMERDDGRTDEEHKSGGGAQDEDLYSDDTDLEEEMMRIDPADSEWRMQMHKGDPVDAQNVFGNWCPAMVQRVVRDEVLVRYLNMHHAWQRWLPVDSGQLAPPASKSRNDSAPLRLAQAIEVHKPSSSLWRDARVVRATSSDVLVRFVGRHRQFDEWLSFTPDFVAAEGEHLDARRLFSIQRRLSATPSNNHCRVIQTQNPRFAHYQQALAAHGLRIHAVQGDGNCLFRSVSHQVYGNDMHHARIRQLCMDYMEDEKEYFEPYVVGDMTQFLRYLAHKRRDGVWGDDPEIQAMCELYDRPAEVYAYDRTHGFRKLRTFHESSAVTRNRPPICLSYYGGGHYDSLVGPQHAENVVNQPPGVLEQRHIEYSRRINTRDGGEIMQRTPLATDQGVNPEMSDLEQILIRSRNEFDAMNSNLDQSLQLTLAESEATAVDSEQRALHAATQESEMASIQAELLEKARHESEEELMRKAIAASLQERQETAMIDPTNIAANTPSLPTSDFDEQVSAAIAASLAESSVRRTNDGVMWGVENEAHGTVHGDDEDDEMQRILKLSANEYEQAAIHELTSSTAAAAANDDEMDEIQRAIQASLQDST